MSHLKEYKTNIENLEYLKAALNRMQVSHHLSGQNIILPQTKTKNALFCWNGESYTLLYDLDFWTNSLSINSFTEKVKREYSAEKVVNGMEKFGFCTHSYENSVKIDQYQSVKAKDLILSRYSF